MNKFSLWSWLIFQSITLYAASSLNREHFNFAVPKKFTVVTANINLMPKGLSIATSGKADIRARQIADSLIKQYPHADIIVLQEMYDDEASKFLIQKLKASGYDYYPGPTKQQLETYWKKKYCFVLGSAKNSGQGVFVRKASNLKVDSYNVLPFINAEIEGIGVLEAYVPKGVIHLKLSRNEGNESFSLFAHHLQAEIGLFALSRVLHGQLKEFPKTILSDLIHFQPYQKLRDKYPNYLQAIRKRQLQATMKWIKTLKKEGKVANQILHIGDFNFIANTPEYNHVLKLMHVVPITDKSLITICDPENTTWSRWTRPFYIALGKYINNYGWMDLGLVSSNLKRKVDTVEVIDLKNEQGKSVTDHESVAVTFDDLFEKES